MGGREGRKYLLELKGWNRHSLNPFLRLSFHSLSLLINGLWSQLQRLQRQIQLQVNRLSSPFPSSTLSSLPLFIGVLPAYTNWAFARFSLLSLEKKEKKTVGTQEWKGCPKGPFVRTSHKRRLTLSLRPLKVYGERDWKGENSGKHPHIFSFS